MSKERPVFGQKLSHGFKSTHEAYKPSGNKTQEKQSSKPESWPDYFAKMDPTELILFASTAFRQPKDASVDQFYSYNYDSFCFLDTDLSGPDYQDVARILNKWTKVGLLVVGSYSNLLSLQEGAAGAFWQFIDKQATPELFDVVPEQAYTADLSGTLDNIFNFLVMVEQGEVLITRTQEINKHSLKRVLAALTEPTRPQKLFTPESYFFWLMGVARYFQWFRPEKDRLELTRERNYLRVLK